MSEPTQHTNVDGDVNGNALSGSFSGPVQTGQNVVVNLPTTPEPPASIKQQIKDMWVMIFSDQIQRRERQQYTDRIFILIGIGLVISLAMGIINSVWIAQLVQRFGWLW